MHALLNGNNGLRKPLWYQQNRPVPLAVKLKMLRSLFMLAASLILSTATLAHEGHGDPSHQQGPTHYVVNPSHAVPIVLTVACGIGAGLLIRRGWRGWRT